MTNEMQRHLTLVTITGADDEVPPSALADLSAEYPFVEWGILRSATRAGTPRYPTEGWIRCFNDVVTAKFRGTEQWCGSAHHLCGSLARDAMSGKLTCTVPKSSRVQLNGFTEFVRDPENILDINWGREYADIVAQCKEVAVLRFASWIHSPCDPKMKLTALFDPSGGRGVTQREWPDFGCAGIGFAGGIGPENVLEVVRTLNGRGNRFWIDMESGVRTNDRLDFDKVRAVLEAARTFVWDLTYIRRPGSCWPTGAGSRSTG